ncbi:hypothetical protein [uncultured Shimia sp.]|uniref:hypothetical protein n=1 Tax=uncultured Shimia sp. TaxID=573152 RepID=UPI0026313C7C|nr:hypothetical protein [uncultured Shimia sp.]
MIAKRNKQGTLVGTFDEARFDINKPVQGTTMEGLVQMGQSNGLNAAVWHRVYALATDLTP